jgi:hypothetical protein
MNGHKTFHTHMRLFQYSIQFSVAALFGVSSVILIRTLFQSDPHAVPLFRSPDFFLYPYTNQWLPGTGENEFYLTRSRI